jgi:hypothetical protein
MLGCEIKDERDRLSVMRGTEQKCILRILWVKLKEAEHLEDLTQMEGYGLD